jgi:hypothetical protein
LAARIIGEAIGRPHADLHGALRRRPGILVGGLRRRRAERIARELSDMGMPAFALREADFVIPPPATTLTSGQVKGTGFACVGPEGPTVLPWEQIILIEVGQIRKSKTITTKERIPYGRRVYYGGIGGVGMARSYGSAYEKRTRTKWQTVDLFDIVCYDPWLHVRLNKATFKFAATGLPRHPTREANLAGMAAVFKMRCSNAVAGEGVELLFDGDPGTRGQLASEEAFENHMLWLTQLRFRRSAD